MMWCGRTEAGARGTKEGRRRLEGGFVRERKAWKKVAFEETLQEATGRYAERF